MNCNRGPDGKFTAPPDRKFFENLLRRNLLFVEEHKHSLKNSIFLSLAVTDKKGVERRMKQLYGQFEMLSGWSPKRDFDS